MDKEIRFIKCLYMSYSVLDSLFSIDYIISKGVMKNKKLPNLIFYPVVP